MKNLGLKYFSDEKDIVFKVDDKIYELNKYILNISPVLKKIISNQFTEANEEIKEINILHKKQWKIFLNYVYYRYCLFLDYEYVNFFNFFISFSKLVTDNFFQDRRYI